MFSKVSNTSNGGATSFHRQHGSTLPSGLTQIYPCLAEQLNVIPGIAGKVIYFLRIHNTDCEPSTGCVKGIAALFGSRSFG